MSEKREIQIGTYGVLADWGYDAARISKVTAQTVTCLRVGSGRERRADRSKLVAWNLTEQDAAKLAARLTGAKAECRRREEAAQRWLRVESARLAETAMDHAVTSVQVPA